MLKPVSDNTKCADCGEKIFSPQVSSLCPSCGSNRRRLDIKINLKRMPIEVPVRVVTGDTTEKSSPQTIRYIRSLTRKTNRVASVIRFIDRINDRYDKMIIDEKAGEIIYECHEPLTQHRGRGSARKP
jgi:predicted Zn-ribbon and HTH transcriptional regulator